MITVRSLRQLEEFVFLPAQRDLGSLHGFFPDSGGFDGGGYRMLTDGQTSDLAMDAFDFFIESLENDGVEVMLLEVGLEDW